MNVLIALLWPRHVRHPAAERWFQRNRKRGWATCPFTHAGFVRIVSNPAFSRDYLKPSDAIKLLSENTAAAEHRFWEADFPIQELQSRFANRLSSYHQVTDMFLSVIASKHNGVLVTFDAGILNLFENSSGSRAAVELIEA